MSEREETDWQPVETEPNHQESHSLRLLGWSSQWGHGFAQFTPFYKGRSDESEMLWVFEGTAIYRPTHWQPLPLPPSQETP